MIANLVSRALPFLNKALPMGIASQGLSKIDPRIKNFIQSSLAAGYTMDTVLDFVRDKFQGESSKKIKAGLEQRESSRRARPDERSALASIRQSSEPGDILQTGVGIATGLGAGMLGMGEGQPQQQQAVQPSEVMPAEDQSRMLGQQQQMQQLQGPPAEQPMQQPEGPIPMGSKGQAPMVGNVLNLLASYDQELSDVVGAQMGQGADAQQLASHLKQSSRFKGAISRLEKDTVSSFEKLLSSLMNFQKPKTREEALGAFRQKMMNRNAMQGQQAPQAQQQSGGNEALMAAINKIMSM